MNNNIFVITIIEAMAFQCGFADETVSLQHRVEMRT